MIGKDVKVIEYSKRIDFLNCTTHAVGAIAAVPLGGLLFLKAEGFRESFSVIVYSVALFAVYIFSTVYHGLKPSEKKRKARLLDHSAVPLLIAGTATPCALISLYRVSMSHSIFVFVLAWSCTLFGIFSKFFFFEKLKAVTMAVYMISGALMLLVTVPLLGEINTDGFSKLVIGCVFYVIGAIFCGLGIKREIFHPIFHIFVLFGSFCHYYVIYNFVL